jgi:very-short-patch-repair endonuclease
VLPTDCSSDEYKVKAHLRYKDIPPYIRELARKNRFNPTPQEDNVWRKIRAKQLNDCKFRRQFPIGRYIVDFYSHTSKLVIEIDGGIHALNSEYDKIRDEYLFSCGYTVMRFSNHEIDTAIDEVIMKISRHIKQHPPAGE